MGSRRSRPLRLLIRALNQLTDAPDRHGVSEVPGRPGVFGYHVRYNRDAVPAVHRMQWPRHAVFFRVGDYRQAIRLLRLLYDRMLPNLWVLPSDDAP